MLSRKIELIRSVVSYPKAMCSVTHTSPALYSAYILPASVKSTYGRPALTRAKRNNAGMLLRVERINLYLPQKQDKMQRYKNFTLKHLVACIGYWMR